MKKILLIAPLAVGLMFSLAACTAAADDAPVDVASAGELTGLWRMTSLEVGSEGDLEEVPYSGQIAFTDDTVAVQAMNPDASAEDTIFTLGGYEAFYGTATFDGEEQSFAVEVESAAARDLIGQTLERRFQVDGDTLVVTPIDPADGFRVTYERHAD